ncbi:MAG: polyprenyl synthetase family protein [Tannerella sp.]|jgi:octaprenyl-diphosphate synthase|nr:polyprenyl synthetase family protein [Tannerella sp.]
MIELQQIIKPVATEFEQFQKDFAEVLHSEVPLLQSAIEQVLRSGGKHIRPLLLLLAAAACDHPNALTREAAVIAETLHTATLIHDDVIDETKQRRGQPSLNAIFDNRIAVLTGDFMLAGALLRASQTGHVGIVNVIAAVCRELSEGEMIELDNTLQSSCNESDYFKMINKKTGALIASCAELGALTVNASPEMTEKCRLIGQYLGLCFQIKDDIFDYLDNACIGKPTGNDVREGKITLPLIYALRTAPAAQTSVCVEMINNKDYTPANITHLLAFAKQHGGIEYAEQRLTEHKRQAVELIASLPDTPARAALLLLADFIAERTL